MTIWDLSLDDLLFLFWKNYQFKQMEDAFVKNCPVARMEYFLAQKQADKYMVQRNRNVPLDFLKR